jgi:hypothetical protein|tara:strand:+ start:1613 stop:2515 length:903 start_codon:yes stop_codon:yes gene_type:complete
MPINAHPDFLNAERKFQEASTDEERITALEEMIKYMPKHKSAEALRKNLRTRYKRLKKESERKAKKSGKKGIKKEDMQAVLVGLTNSGKSSLLKALTNTYPKIASYGFTTEEPNIGTLFHQGCSIQIIDLPPIASDNFNKGIINNTDTIIIVVEKIDEIRPIIETIKDTKAKKIIVFNKLDLHNEKTKRKISETLKAKKHNFSLVSTITDEGIEDLKDKILNSFNFIRIYTKHQGKKKENIPVILKPNSTLSDVAEKILHGFSKKVKYAKVSGPSSKFLGQKVGLKHVLKDKDTVEFFTE